jgi:hypothetical protein
MQGSFTLEPGFLRRRQTSRSHQAVSANRSLSWARVEISEEITFMNMDRRMAGHQVMRRRPLYRLFIKTNIVSFEFFVQGGVFNP